MACPSVAYPSEASPESNWTKSCCLVEFPALCLPMAPIAPRQRSECAAQWAEIVFPVETFWSLILVYSIRIRFPCSCSYRMVLHPKVVCHSTNVFLPSPPTSCFKLLAVRSRFFRSLAHALPRRQTPRPTDDDDDGDVEFVLEREQLFTVPVISELFKRDFSLLCVPFRAPANRLVLSSGEHCRRCRFSG